MNVDFNLENNYGRHLWRGVKGSNNCHMNFVRNDRNRFAPCKISLWINKLKKCYFMYENYLYNNTFII